MKKTGWYIVIGIIVILGIWYFATRNKALAPEEQSGLANPASVHCVQELKGTLEIRDEAGGQVGYCHVSDGRICEEWALYRDGTCTPPPTTTPAPSSDTTGGTSSSPAIGGTLGAHCGGFIQNAPQCATGFRCQLNVNNPDTGGTCVPDTSSAEGK